MGENKVDRTLTAEEAAQVEASLQTMKDVFEFAVGLTDDERQRIPKAGNKSQAFLDKALDAAKAHSKILPPFVDVDGYERDVTLHRQTSRLAERLAVLHRKIEDTAMVAGSEAYQTSLMLYGFFQAVEKDQPGLTATVNDLGERFRAQSARNSEPALEPTE